MLNRLALSAWISIKRSIYCDRSISSSQYLPRDRVGSTDSDKLVSMYVIFPDYKRKHPLHVHVLLGPTGRYQFQTVSYFFFMNFKSLLVLLFVFAFCDSQVNRTQWVKLINRLQRGRIRIRQIQKLTFDPSYQTSPERHWLRYFEPRVGQLGFLRQIRPNSRDVMMTSGLMANVARRTSGFSHSVHSCHQLFSKKSLSSII